MNLPAGSHDGAQPEWRNQFPIDLPEDEYRSRRDFTRLLGLTSFAFVVGQAWIIVHSFLRRWRTKLAATEIGGGSEMAVGAAQVFHYPGENDPCVLVRLAADRFVAFEQKCTHLSCPVIPRLDEKRFHCPCHNGSFDIETGQPLAGPPRRALARVLIEVRDGRVWATGEQQPI